MFRQTKRLVENAQPCIGCGSKPLVLHYDVDMWYAMCSNPNCRRFSKWTFLGASESGAINVWQDINRPIMRGKK